MTDLTVLFVLLYIGLVVTENVVKLLRWWFSCTPKNDLEDTR